MYYHSKKFNWKPDHGTAGGNSCHILCPSFVLQHNTTPKKVANSLLSTMQLADGYRAFWEPLLWVTMATMTNYHMTVFVSTTSAKLL